MTTNSSDPIDSSSPVAGGAAPPHAPHVLPPVAGGAAPHPAPHVLPVLPPVAGGAAPPAPHASIAVDFGKGNDEKTRIIELGCGKIIKEMNDPLGGF